MEIISRREARALGLTRFFTGKECPRGHISERYTSTGGCKSCLKENKPRWAETQRACARRSYAKHREKRLEISKRYAAENPDIPRRAKIKWAQNNPEKVKALKSRYCKENPEIAREWFRRRWAKIKGAEGSHTAEEAEQLLIAQDFICNNPYCDADLKQVGRQLDHIHPLTPRDGSAPGSNGVENLQWLCRKCNAMKANKSWERFLADYLAASKKVA